MPSGHTTASFAFAVAVSAHLAGTSRARRGVVSALVILSAAGVAAARVYLNQHWLSDVVVGALLGISTGRILARWHRAHPDTAFDRALVGAPLPR